MISLRLKSEPYDCDYYKNAAPGGRTGVGRLPHLRGKVAGLPGLDRTLVVTSDLQGRLDYGEPSDPNPLLGVTVAHKLAERHRNIGRPEPKECIALLAGDFYADPECNVRGASGDVSPVWAAFMANCHQVVGVLGNHDHPLGQPEVDRRMHCLDGKLVEIDHLRVAGISGVIGNPKRSLRRSLDQFLALLRTLIASKPGIILMHESPQPAKGDRGYPEIAALIEESGFEGLVISGHAEWSNRMVVRGSAIYLNAHEAVITLTPAKSAFPEDLDDE